MTFTQEIQELEDKMNKMGMPEFINECKRMRIRGEPRVGERCLLAKYISQELKLKERKERIAKDAAYVSVDENRIAIIHINNFHSPDVEMHVNYHRDIVNMFDNYKLDSELYDYEDDAI